MSLGKVIKAASTSLAKRRDPETVDELHEIWELHCLGNSPKELAKVYGVTPSIVRGWIDKYRSEYAAEMSRTQRSMLLTDSLAFYRMARDTAMAEYKKCEKKTLVVTEDGEIRDTDTNLDPRLMTARARLLKTALDAEKSAADLLVKTGVLPSAAKDINISIMDANNENAREQVAEDEAARTEKEIVSSIERYLTSSARLVAEVPEDEIIDVEAESRDEG